MNKNFETLKISFPQKRIMLVQMNRPNYSNAFNTKMATEILSLFNKVESTINQTRVIVLTGSGKKAFSAGGDLKERNKMTNQDWFKQHVIFEKMIRSIINCTIPTMGAINGAAFGGGCELVASLDFVYAAKNAVFAQTETKIGIIPGIGGTQNLARAVGERRAKEIILTGKPFSARQALEWGLVNAIYDAENLLTEAIETADSIAQNAPLAVKAAKIAISKGLDMPLKDGMSFELEEYNKVVVTQDRKEGVLAFNEKRSPKFKGL